MATTSKSLWLNAGAVAAAIGASLCCILPVAVALLGVGSAALGAQLEPFRPYCELPGYPYVQPALRASRTDHCRGRNSRRLLNERA